MRCVFNPEEIVVEIAKRFGSVTVVALVALVNFVRLSRCVGLVGFPCVVVFLCK